MLHAEAAGAIPTKGADYVALTMFADQQHDEPSEIEASRIISAAKHWSLPPIANLKPYWIYKQNRHPMEFSMKDIIDHNFAAIWLTAAEFAGPLCQPPRLTGNPLLARNPPPPWLEYGSARATFDFHIGSYDSIEEIAKKEWYRRFGRVPAIGHHAYAIGIIARDGDPNVGHPPRDQILHKNELGGYIPPYCKEAEPFDLAQLSTRNHLGGTMFPEQWTPKFSATYLEIEEHFGGFNFGGGNAQLDLATMEFDWACGESVHHAFIKQTRWNREKPGTSHISFRCRRGQCNHVRRTSMTNRFMMSVAAAALIAGTGFANAQGSREAPAAGRDRAADRAVTGGAPSAR